jgi:hypothetical protein
MLWGWIALVAGGIVAAVVTRLLWPTGMSELHLRHVAGATLIGVVGWMALLWLPSTLIQLTSPISRLPDAGGTSPYGPYVLAAIAVVVGSAVAVIGILRRKRWGTVLGVGMAAAYVGTSILGAVGWLAVMGQATGYGGILMVYGAVYLLGAVPALVAIALLLWPARGRASTPAGDREAADGIIDADSEAARGIDWPEWNAPAERT